MATRNARRKSATGATEKKGKGKWIVIFLLLILLAALAWYFLFNSAEKNFFSDFLPGSDATDMITVEKDKQLSMETISQSESKVDASIEDSPPQPPPPARGPHCATAYRHLQPPPPPITPPFTRRPHYRAPPPQPHPPPAANPPRRSTQRVGGHWSRVAAHTDAGAA